ncbi:Mannosyl-oligosaccharide alpha-1,2-mannosidase IA [Psilocybe cubensis]|uniref:alpha-1,2-Mannosidase n=2 Tax=Psilocybe cubensis TaxID=181762 RepID=A0A8H7XT51_PSICU|nr:Mannosyl-oligosaccharide alpha-1,2-mannosidase IA [Psilocybe cubensis]KAH9479527.1 Mannosyl-oligosaccharide alpha-1,2-mannosidase IA [Psilocybe cubensis]
MSIKVHLDAEWRNWLRLSHTRPMLRNLIYGAILFLTVYTLFNLSSLKTSQFSIFPGTKDSGEVVSAEVWSSRADQVKQAFRHAYSGYVRYAAPADELAPLRNSGINVFNGWGATAFDSLDTMLLMGLDDEYKHALDIVKKADLSRAEPHFVPFFETVIRYLGGLLSAYALSKDVILLDKAEELVRRLDPIFETPTGMPYFSVNPKTGEHWGPDIGILAEIASLQLEYAYLAKLTGKVEHYNRSEAVMKALSSADLRYTSDIRATTYIITNLLYLSPTRNLLYVTDAIAGSYNQQDTPSHIQEHLSCFFPGLLALGAHTLPLDNLAGMGVDFEALANTDSYGLGGQGYAKIRGYNLKELHMWAAKGLGQTCWATYADQPTGLGPEEILMQIRTGQKTWMAAGGTWSQKPVSYLWIDAVEKWRQSGGKGVLPGLADPKPVLTSTGRDYTMRKSSYLLRPETIESMYLLWKVSGDVKWRMRGWRVFEAIERETKTASGYASVVSVDMAGGSKRDSMPSYFLAETLKYLYLMFRDDDPISLDEWVFNTEAHPFPVFKWTAEERARFNV